MPASSYVGCMQRSLQLRAGSLLLHFLANWGFREAVLFLVLMNIFLARSLIFSFLVFLLDCLALQDFKLVNLLPQILPFLPGDGVLGCLTGTSKGRGVGRGADEAL